MAATADPPTSNTTATSGEHSENSKGAVDPTTIDWSNLSWSQIQTRSFVFSTWENGIWSPPTLRNDFDVPLSILSTGLHYGQSCFEGLKGFRMKDGKIRVFRPQMNCARLAKSCQILAMPEVPESVFLEALSIVIRDNQDYVPPGGSGGSLYIRPVIFGTTPSMPLAPSRNYYFAIIVMPVGEFYKGGFGKAAKALIKYRFDRAATWGTGRIKMGGNYPAALNSTEDAKKKGFTVMLFLDAKENKYVDEFATSNFVALTKADEKGKRTYVTPKSPSALPSVTNKSLGELAIKIFGWNAERREIAFEELKNGTFEEVAACGTAVIVTPVGEVCREVPSGKTHSSVLQADAKRKEVGWWGLDEDEEDVVDVDLEKVDLTSGSGYAGFRKLYDALRGLQTGELEGWAEFEWMWPAEGI